MIRPNLSCWIIFTLFSVVSCSENRRQPNDTIPREKFTQLYVQLLIAGESGHFSNPDTAKARSKKAVVDSILAEHHVTELQVRHTLQEYSKDLKSWKEFYDGVIKRLEEMQHEDQTRKR